MQPPSSIPGPRYKALLQLLRTAEALWNVSRVFFARWDLSPSQFNVLNLLHGKPSGCSQIELSRDLIMHRSNVTGLIDRLEARKLVIRERDLQDRRSHRVVLTSDGTELLNKLLPIYFQAAEAVWGNMSSARTQELLSDLTTVCSKAEEEAAHSQTQPVHTP